MTIDARLRDLVFGQPECIEAVLPAIYAHQANLSPPRRPAGSFLLLGPTGTGKTHFVESVASVLHSGPLGQMVLKVNCAEFQQDHEIAKLIGAPPGYVGHASNNTAGTPALLHPSRIASYRTHQFPLAIILFDEVEKASDALARLLLGILDKALMRTGGNEDVNFEATLIFMTSNLGAREQNKALSDKRVGFPGAATRNGARELALNAAKKHFSPEFINRLDAMPVFDPLPREVCARILDGYIDAYNEMVKARRASESFTLIVTPRAKVWLLDRGVSREYGARELRRVFERNVLYRVARDIQSKFLVTADVAGDAIVVEWSNAHLKARTA